MGKRSNAWLVNYKYRQLIGEDDTFLWLSRGEMKAENESEITAAQNQPGLSNKISCKKDITNRNR
jgi:hypothetical protein